MRKRTLVSKIRENERSLGEVKGEDLLLALGGVRTITQDPGGKVIVKDDDTIEI